MYTIKGAWQRRRRSGENPLLHVLRTCSVGKGRTQPVTDVWRAWNKRQPQRKGSGEPCVYHGETAQSLPVGNVGDRLLRDPRRSCSRSGDLDPGAGSQLSRSSQPPLADEGRNRCISTGLAGCARCACPVGTRARSQRIAITARHTTKVGNTRSRWPNHLEGAVEGGVGDWGEVVRTLRPSSATTSEKLGCMLGTPQAS